MFYEDNVALTWPPWKCICMPFTTLANDVIPNKIFKQMLEFYQPGLPTIGIASMQIIRNNDIFIFCYAFLNYWHFLRLKRRLVNKCRILSVLFVKRYSFKEKNLISILLSKLEFKTKRKLANIIFQLNKYAFLVTWLLTIMTMIKIYLFLIRWRNCFSFNTFLPFEQGQVCRGVIQRPALVKC